jgi:hypothetical protein
MVHRIRQAATAVINSITATEAIVKSNPLLLAGGSMIENLESNYDCANAGDDLHQLQLELNAYHGDGNLSGDDQESLNRIKNQISFIKNKCSIH